MMARILVVDDEKSIRITLREFLRAEQYQVETAESAEDAMKILSRKNFDIVLTDVIMPRVTGIELLKSIKEIAPEVEVLIMTGEPTVETASDAVREGALDYLSKPIRKAQLLKTVAVLAASGCWQPVRPLMSTIPWRSAVVWLVPAGRERSRWAVPSRWQVHSPIGPTGL